MTRTPEQIEHLKLWVAALRSGEYKQGRWQLRKGDSFCVLGVGCDVMAKAGVGHWSGELFETEDDIEGDFLPFDARLFYGLWGDEPLPYLNDK